MLQYLFQMEDNHRWNIEGFKYSISLIFTLKLSQDRLRSSFFSRMHSGKKVKVKDMRGIKISTYLNFIFYFEQKNMFLQM